MWRSALWAFSILPASLFSIFPVAFLAWRALHDEARVAWSSSTVPLLARTLLLCASVATTATLLGTILGYRLGVSAWSGKSLARIVLLLPLLIPPYLHAVGWTTLLRSDGAVARTLESLFSIEPARTSESIYSFAGAVFILTLAYCPIAILFAEKALAWSSPALVETAQVFGAGRFRTFCTARWPYLKAPAASSALIIFLLTASELGVPTILKVPVFNFEVFTQLAAFNDISGATLLCAPLLAIGLIAVAIERTVTGPPPELLSPDIEPPRAAATGAAVANWLNVVLFTFVALLAPLGAIIANGIDPDALFKMVRIASYPAWSTARYVIGVVIGLLVLSAALAAALRGAPRLVGNVTDGLLSIGFAVPSTIIGLGLLAAYDRPDLARIFTPFVLVVAAIVVRYTIIGVRVLQQARDHIPSELFDASAVAGAGRLGQWAHVTLPLTRVALAAIVLIGVVVTNAEIGSTILLHAPGEETLAIALYAIEANSPRSYVAALALIQLCFLAGIALVVTFSLRLGFRR